MGLHSYCLSLLEKSCPCFLANLESDEILFVNTEMQTLLGEKRDILGKRVYDVMQVRGQQFPYRPELGETFGAFFLTQMYDETLGERFQTQVFEEKSGLQFTATHTLFEHNGMMYNLCKYEQMLEKCTEILTFEEAMTECISILNNKAENDTIPAFLELLGHFYKSEKAHLFRIDHENQSITAMNHWTKDDAIPFVPSVGTAMDVPVVLNWLESRNEVGIIEANENHKAMTQGSAEEMLLQTFGLKNLVLSAIEDSAGHLIATLGLGNREEATADYRLLQAVSQFIEQKVSKAEMTIAFCNMSQKDILTGFGSRSAYGAKVEELQDTPPKTIGVVFINVNGVKKINTEFGYAKGDGHIKTAAKLAKEHLKGEFYRISGDEFVAFYPEISKADFDQLISSMYATMKTHEAPIFALGHAWSTGRYELIPLVQEADTVMYINKQEYYHTSNRRFEEIGDSTLSDLLSFLDNDEFMVYLQPQVRLKDGSLHGAEALIRRFDKTNQKMVFPDQFIPLYEKKSVIRHIDIFVVEKVCQLLREWEKYEKMIPISVNLSRVTLLEFGIVDTIARICDKYQVPHHLLVIEVTERVGLIENDVESSLISEFNSNGFSISLDDFGCAYSNIVTLAQITVNEVKIDKSLVDYLATNKKNRILVKNILAMCNELDDTDTLAEGIEDEEQAQLLRDYQCTLGQGYLYSRPIPVPEFFDKYVDVK